MSGTPSAAPHLAEAKPLTFVDHVTNIYHLVIKELRSIRADPVMLVFLADARGHAFGPRPRRRAVTRTPQQGKRGRVLDPLLCRDEVKPPDGLFNDIDPKLALPFFEMNWARNSRNHQTTVVCSP
jgi:hypothetical protein